MAYSTRRKSVNLSLLGIQLPRPFQKSPPSPSNGTSPTTSSLCTTTEQSQPPSKKIKISHDDSDKLSAQHIISSPIQHNSTTSPTAQGASSATTIDRVKVGTTSSSSISTPSSTSSTPTSTSISTSLSSSLSSSSSPPTKHKITKNNNSDNNNVNNHDNARTPPPSPPPTTSTTPQIKKEDDEQYPKVDCEGINDEVVVATIEQLEMTNNRPHLLKELAIAIAGHVSVVETSANQSAIISSRLTNFMKRPWTNISPCPLGKDLIGTHPKRLYFYLSARPHLPFPDPEPRSNAANRIISPSLTSASTTDEADDSSRRRSELSPSPELDLVDHSINFDTVALARNDTHSSIATSVSSTSAGPALERDEHEFTQTANALQLLRKKQSAKLNTSIQLDFSPLMDLDDDSDNDSEDMIVKRTFGSSDFLLPMPTYDTPSYDKADTSFTWSDLKSPETVDMDELDNLFESY